MRTRHLLPALAVLAASVSVEAVAARRATVLLLPVDKNSGKSAMEFTEYIEAAVGKRANYSLRAANEVLGDSTPTAALEARKRVITALNEGKRKFAEGQFDEAESSLRTALVDVNNASAAMERCGEYCETLAYLAGAQMNKGDEEGARGVLKNLLAIERSFKFDKSIFGNSLVVLAKDVQKQLLREPLVSVNIQSLPTGGKVYLDGAYKGYAPITVNAVVAGRHLLRIERPGAVTYGELVELGGSDESAVKAKLTATPEYGALEGSLDKIAEEIDRGESSAELMRLGPKLRVDRAIIGLVRSTERKVTLECVLVDFKEKRRLARKTRSFEGNEYGELEKEAQRFGNLLLAEGEGGPKEGKEGSDPLDSRSGVEDWDEEGSGGSGGGEDRPAPKKDKPRKKPEKKNEEAGTGDW